MKKFLKKILKYILNFAAIFAILFTMSIIIFTSISQYVYENVGFIRELLTIACVCAGMSVVIVVFLQINRITPLVQLILIYCFVFVVIFIMGYFLYIYDFHNNTRLLISTIAFFMIGLICIITIQLIVSKKNDASLNANLKQFKERGK